MRVSPTGEPLTVAKGRSVLPLGWNMVTMELAVPKERPYIVFGDICRYEALLRDPQTTGARRAMVAGLLAETRVR